MHFDIRNGILVYLGMALALAACGTGVREASQTENFTLSGVIKGLDGSGLMISNTVDGTLKDTLTKNGNSLFTGGEVEDIPFTFKSVIQNGNSYKIAVDQNPTERFQSCVVRNGEGRVVNANIDNIEIVCSTTRRSIGGKINGLLPGTSVTLQNSNGELLTVTPNSRNEFSFTSLMFSGDPYRVVVVPNATPTTPEQFCTVSNNSGTVRDVPVTTMTLTCALTAHYLHANITGLDSNDVLLRSDVADELLVSSDKAQDSFKARVPSGADYTIEIATQPSNPYQVCSPAKFTGRIGATDETINIHCSTQNFNVKGVVTGLNGSGLKLLNNGVDTLDVDPRRPTGSDVPFSFKSPIKSLEKYEVSISQQPATPDQNCNISAGSGTVLDREITGVVVNCDSNRYTIGGRINGLVPGGGGVKLRNGSYTTVQTANGNFSFPVPEANGVSYAISIETQPTSPRQTCTLIQGGTGVVKGANISDIVINCVTQRYTVGGKLTGLASGSRVTLRMNKSASLTLSANGSFQFNGDVPSGSVYAVTVTDAPADQRCTVGKGVGVVSANHVSNIEVNCSGRFFVRGTVSGLIAGRTLALEDVQAGSVEILGDSNPDGHPFTLPGGLFADDLYNVEIRSAPAGESCRITNGSGRMGNADVSNVTVVCTPKTYTLRATVTGISGAPLSLFNNATTALARDPVSGIYSLDLSSGVDYSVSVGNPPADLVCLFGGKTPIATGNVVDADITLAVNCAPLALGANALSQSISLQWLESGATSYDLYYTTNSACDPADLARCASASTVASVVSPYLLSKLTNNTPYYLQLKANFGGNRSVSSMTITARPDRLGFNGPIHTSAVDANGNVYVGGDFSSVGAVSGGGVPFNISRGWPTTWGYAKVAGRVQAVVADGSGGFYIGGLFTSVGGLTRNNLAHILADGKVDPNWAPAANNAVNALAIDNGVVYVGGSFSTMTIGSVTTAQAYLAAIKTTGELDTRWAPVVGGSTVAISSLVANTGVVYVGGLFDSVASNGTSLSASNLFAVQADGVLRTAWLPTANGIVYALAIDNNMIYIGGEFTQVTANNISTSTGQRFLAAVSTAGNLSTNWTPSANRAVQAMITREGMVYIGGQFSALTVNGAVSARQYLAAVGVDGQLNNDWSPATDKPVYTLAASTTTVYAGGDFTRVTAKGVTKTSGYLAAITKNGHIDSRWIPTVNLRTDALAIDGDVLYAGGQFTSISSNGALTSRGRLAALGADGGLSSTWAPIADAPVLSIAIATSKVYVGGDFTQIATGTTNARRNYVAAINSDGSVDTQWAPAPNGSVKAIAIDAGLVYLGGNFTSFVQNNSTMSRKYLAAVVANTGLLSDTWVPVADNYVQALAVSNSTVFIGGRFNAISTGSVQTATNQRYLAAVGSDGALKTAWAPVLDDTVSVIATTAGRVYVGGAFTSITTQGIATSVGRIVALNDIDAGLIFNPPPIADNNVFAIAAAGPTLYLGGWFDTVNATGARIRLAAVNSNTGRLNATWLPSMSSHGGVSTLATFGNTVYVGGQFHAINGEVTGNFVAVDNSAGALVP